jgi:hypothetical protein
MIPIVFHLLFCNRYMIDELALGGEFVVDLRVKLCYTKGKPCEHDVTVLTGLRLPKPLCQLQTGQFPIPGRIKSRQATVSATDRTVPYSR